jgi:2-C-methyl-D-erythritol 4-phosphate cytidylyltransferase
MKRKSTDFTQSFSVVIVAAGQGTRMNMGENKQYIQIGGKSVLARAISIFEELVPVKEIIVVVNEHDILYCKESIIGRYNFKKIKAIVAGGKERQNSVFNGLKEVNAHCGIVLIHDGARPFTDQESIFRSLESALEFGASCVAVPVKDTIKKGNSEGFVNETFDRSSLWAIQTPQAFKYDIIMDAHKKAIKDGYLGTDDAVLVERLGFQMKLVMGSYDNIKITTQEDLYLAEAIAAKAEIEK